MKESVFHNGLRITLARSAGFCFGVKRAIRMARRLAETRRGVRMLGDLVHNETVIREMETIGIRKIKRLGAGRGHTLLIRAHGAAGSVLAAARRRGYRVADATCPRVRDIQRIVRRMDRAGYTIIVIGDPRHDEVLGIVGQIRRRAYVIRPDDPAAGAGLPPIAKAAVVVQSTQNIESVLPLVAKLEARIARLRFFNTICAPTRLKQEDIRRLPRTHDVMIVIGSRTSANTRRLYEISKELNPATYWIQAAAELRNAWFAGARSVGLTAGASTPDRTTREVLAAIGEISKGVAVSGSRRSTRAGP